MSYLQKLPSKFRKMYTDFETMMDPSRNHRVYRLTVGKMHSPMIPFMPLLMKGNPTNLYEAEAASDTQSGLHLHIIQYLIIVNTGKAA